MNFLIPFFTLTHHGSRRNPSQNQSRVQRGRGQSHQREKGTYTHRDYNQSYSDTQATERATIVAAQLAKAIADVAHYTAEAARPALTPAELRAARRALIAATARRDNLRLSSETVSGPEAYLDQVDGDQVDGQIAVFDQRIQDVTAHKDTLSS